MTYKNKFVLYYSDDLIDSEDYFDELDSEEEYELQEKERKR
jgi:hypothetical protein